jgi:pimeloyl-ACP methyl ester carboxylesterase
LKKRPLLLFLMSFFLLLGLVIFNGRTASASSFAPASQCVDPAATKVLRGTLQGANYTISVPSNWNGTLALYSHGYTSPTAPLANPAPDAGDALTRATLLSRGYALAGSSYSQNGWALQQAFHDQIALLDFFNQTCGKPARVIAWGHSLGGIITAGLIQLNPERFSAALPMCGVLAGGVAAWNQGIDGSFAFNVLLANSQLPIVHITNPTTTFLAASGILNAAQQTPQGRARIALSAALGDVPGWFSATTPEPASDDFATQEQNQFLWLSQVDFSFAFLARAELELRAGGNPSWNTGVNYRKQLALSANHREVQELYKQAGLSLEADLKTLDQAPRIQADRQAVNYLDKYITFNGKLRVPVLAMHTTGDGLVVPEQEQAYASVVREAGNERLLRQIFVHRAGHCTFTPAETVTAFQTLNLRLRLGFWDGITNPEVLNREATALGSTLNIAPAAFIHFQVPQFLRPRDERHGWDD